MMKTYPIKKFGQKLMVASKAINTIPDEYLYYSQNARIYDGGIGPRRGKQLLTDSILGTNNKGGFYMNGKLFQIANSNIYEVDQTTGVQTLKAALGYDATTDILVYGTNIAIISSAGQDLKRYDGVSTVTTIATDPASFPSANKGILEYCRGFSFCSGANILYISRPITAANPEYSYDFTGSGSQNITYDSDIIGLKSTMNGLYIFTKDKVEFLGANSLQNVSGSSTFISTPLGEGSEPMTNHCISASGDNIYYITKNLQVMKISYMQGTNATKVGELSARPVISIKELLNTLDIDQPTSFAFFNQNDKTVQFHVRTVNSTFNDICIVYDEVNDTWNIDTGKNYNYVVKVVEKYYGFSDINSSIYQDDIGFTNGGVPIDFYISLGDIHQGTLNQKIYGGLYVMGGIGLISTINVFADIDQEVVFDDSISGDANGIPPLGEIGGQPIGDSPIGGDLTYVTSLSPFDRSADVGRIFQGGTRMRIYFRSDSLVQDFIIDSVGMYFEMTNYRDIPNAF